jgi:hypothetical protein
MVNNENINFYEKMSKKHKNKYHNPAYGKSHIFKIPFRMIIAGSSSAGKTSSLLNIIHRMPDTFEKIILCVKNINEPLYLHLIEKIPADFLEIYESDNSSGIVNIPSPDNYKNSVEQILIVFDDLVLENKQTQEKIGQFFIRGRKIAGGISCIYISQSYYKIPKIIRVNTNYLILKNLPSTRDLNMILADSSIGVCKNMLQRVYKDATKSKWDFLLIDVDEGNFYRNYLEKYNITEV